MVSKKMFNDVTVHVTEAVLTGLCAFFGQGVSDWISVLAGGLMASKTAPQLVKTLLDYRKAQKEHRNSSIAYVAGFK